MWNKVGCFSMDWFDQKANATKEINPSEKSK